MIPLASGAKPLGHRTMRVVLVVMMTFPIFVKCHLFDKNIYLWNQHNLESPKQVSAGAPAMSGVTRCQLQKASKPPKPIHFWNQHDLESPKQALAGAPALSGVTSVNGKSLVNPKNYVFLESA